MKKLILISFLFGCSNFIVAQSSVLNDSKIELKPISLHLYKQKTPFQNNTTISPWNVKSYVPVVKNNLNGDYSYNYLNPNNSQYPTESLFVGLANYFLDQTVNKK